MEGRLNFVGKLQILRSKVSWIHSKMYNFWQAQSQSNPIWIDWTEIALIPTTILALQPTHSKMKGKKNLTTKMFFLTLTFFDIKKFNLAQLQSKSLWAWQSSVPACLSNLFELQQFAMTLIISRGKHIIYWWWWLLM